MLLIIKIHEKYKIAYHNYAEAKCTSSAKITLFFKSGYYSNHASDIVPSVKKLCTIKTMIYNAIFISLRCKKVQSPAKQFKELFSLVCYFFALN